jgi:hypothetical protein
MFHMLFHRFRKLSEEAKRTEKEKKRQSHITWRSVFATAAKRNKKKKRR